MATKTRQKAGFLLFLGLGMLRVRAAPFAVLLYHQLPLRCLFVFTGEVIDTLAFTALQSDQIFTEF